MNTDKDGNLNLVVLFISLSLFFIAVAILGTNMYYKSLEKAGKGVAQSAEEIYRDAFKQMRGLPAEVEDLKENTVYAASVSMMNIFDGVTNYYAGLREVTVVNRDHYQYSAEPRFFKLPFSLDPGRYYRFFRSGNTVREEEYPPPSGEPPRVRRKREAPL